MNPVTVIVCHCVCTLLENKFFLVVHLFFRYFIYLCRGLLYFVLAVSSGMSDTTMCTLVCVYLSQSKYFIKDKTFHFIIIQHIQLRKTVDEMRIHYCI